MMNTVFSAESPPWGPPKKAGVSSPAPPIVWFRVFRGLNRFRIGLGFLRFFTGFTRMLLGSSNRLAVLFLCGFFLLTEHVRAYHTKKVFNKKIYFQLFSPFICSMEMGRLTPLTNFPTKSE